MITVSAPGKLMIAGEHAAVYGYPAIVTAVSERMRVSAAFSEDGIDAVDAPQAANTSFVEAALKRTKAHLKLNKRGIRLRTASQFSQTIGFGSSSAVAVATVGAVHLLAGRTPVPETVFTLAYRAVLDVQKTGSGFDVAAATYGGTLLYEGKGKRIEPLPADAIPLVVGYSGVKADTVALVREVARKREAHPDTVERIFRAIGDIVGKMQSSIREGDWERVGVLMNFNQEYLRDLGVSTETLEAMIAGAKNAGAYGAKLSGAGGGDCMMALVPSDKRDAVCDAITKAGGRVLDVAVHSEGMRSESVSQEPE